MNINRVGDYSVTYDVTDTAGNAAEQKTRTVRVIDNTKPIITLTGDNPQTIHFGMAYTELNATATDLVDGELTDNIVIDSSAVNTNAVGQYTVTYNVTDTAGNAAEQKTRTVRVIDNTKPIITLTGDNPQTIHFGMAYTELNATATDLVDGDLTGSIVIDSSAVNTNAVGQYTVTYDVTDTAGNAAEQKTRTVIVEDNTKPIITLTGDNPQTIEFGMAYTELKATATDLVDDDIELTGNIVIDANNVDTSTVGTYTVTYDVTDTAGNAAEQKTRTVRVIDTGKPIITLTGDNPQIIEFGTAYTELEATATDLVDDDTELTSKIVIAGDEVITNQLGTYDVTYNVTDTAGNAADTVTRTVDDPDRAGLLLGRVAGVVGYIVGDRVIPDSVGVHCTTVNDNVAGEFAIHQVGGRCIQFGVSHAEMDGLRIITSQGDNRLAGVDDPDRARHGIGGVTGGIGYIVGDRVIPDPVGVHCTAVNDNVAGEFAIHQVGGRCIQFGVSHAEMDGLRISTGQGDDWLAGGQGHRHRQADYHPDW